MNEPLNDGASTWKTWLAIGATGFGGPAGQVAILHREIVERRGWLDEEEFLAAMRLCMLLPGPEAQQLATYAGWRIGGVPGGLLAGTLFVLPGAVLVTGLAWLHAAGGSLPPVAAAFAGTRPAVVALVALAAWRIGRKSLHAASTVAIAVAALAALAVGLPFPLVVALSALAGVCVPGGTSIEKRPPVDSPASSGIWHAVATTTAFVAAWALAYGVVVALGLAGGTGPAIARLFTETTLLSFGGAYAVVPWALDESVARGWGAPAERFDALAMGEATPGPLILVVTFIGFLAGWKSMAGGGAVPGVEGAAVATVFAFLPSFAMVLALAPFVGRIHPGSWLGRAMTGVGAAVVAAIVVLAVKLSAAAFIVDGRPEFLAVAVAIGSSVALVRGFASAPLVVMAAAVIGVVVDASWTNR